MKKGKIKFEKHPKSFTFIYVNYKFNKYINTNSK